MTDKTKNRLWLYLGGGAVGLINGLLGSGGGMIAVPMLRKIGLSQKESHATAVMLIFFLSLFSAAVYLLGGRLALSSALPYLPGGVIGAAAGALLLKKIPDGALRRVFGIFMVYTGIRLFFK